MRAARMAQATLFAANVLPIIRDIQGQAIQASMQSPGNSTLAEHPTDNPAANAGAATDAPRSVRTTSGTRPRRFWRDRCPLDWGVVLKSLGDPLWDTSSPQGRLLSTLLAIIAEFERELIRERTKVGMAAAKARGIRIGRNEAAN